MTSRKNSNIIGQHAFLSPSTYTWLDAEPEKLIQLYHSRQAAKRGDELHKFAAEAIRLGIPLPDNDKTLNRYVNDALRYRMTPEWPLFYTPVCFGTADAFAHRRDLVRIHDLKTGVKEADMRQLLIYLAIFFFEYNQLGFTPDNTRAVLRIYQNDEINELRPDPSEVKAVMSKVRAQAALIAKIMEEEED